LAPHSISVFNHLIGSLPTSVSAWNKSDCNHTVEIHAELQYGKVGPSGFIHISRGGTQRVRTFTVIGTEKFAVYDDLAESQLKMYRHLPKQELGKGLDREDNIIVPKIEPAEPLAEELRHFLTAIRDRSAPESSGRDGMITVAIMEAIDRSRRNQRQSEVCYPSDLHYGIFPVGASEKGNCVSP
jgi:predicted dehydrogenase